MRLLVVDAEAERSFARPELALHGDWSVTRGGGFLELEGLVKNASPPVDLAIAYQDRPKQFSMEMLRACLAARPLLRVVQVLGPWCDGLMRTPGRLAGVYAMSFREAEYRLSGLVEQFRLGEGPLVAPLAALAALEETSLRQGVSATAERPLRVGVKLRGRLAGGIEACLAALGHTAVMLAGENAADEQVDVVVVDGDAEERDHSPKRTLRLGGFPRPAECPQLGKTFSLAELEAALRRLS